MKYLAVDVGGTSTRAVVVQSDGTCLGYGTAGSGNPTSSGAAVALSSILTAARTATDQSGLTLTDLAAATVGIAGAGGAAGPPLHAELVDAGLSEHVTLEPDLLVAFHSGTIAGAGYALVAGTGSGAVRVRGSRIEVTSDGLGWLLGDGGSGFWIGHRALLAASSALDDRGPPTALVELVLAKLGIEETGSRDASGRSSALQHLVDAVYQLRPIELATFAPLVFDAEATGDDVARQIVDAAADALATTLEAVVVPDIPGPFVLGGSVLTKQPLVARRIVETARVPGHDPVVITMTDGLVGAAVLALRGADETVDDAVLARIRVSLARLR
jgi:N-acetylglucosamine kinase-like BadF-type ATPase